MNNTKEADSSRHVPYTTCNVWCKYIAGIMPQSTCLHTRSVKTVV